VQSPPRFYANGEYLLWWTARDRVPALFTTGVPTGNAAADLTVGALGRPDTTVLFGGSLDRSPQSGGRFTLGYWLDGCDKAVELTGFFLGQRAVNFSTNSGLNPVITRPFLDLNNNRPFVERVALPGFLTGTGSVNAPSQLWGVEANYKCKWWCGCDYQVNLLAGFRYLGLDESITIVETIQGNNNVAPPLSSPQAMATAFDRFATRNQFYGGQVGLEGRWCHDKWVIEARGKLALGGTHEEIVIDGGQSFTNPTSPPDPRVGGLLALNSNIGHHSRNSFSVVPELGLNVGYQLYPNVRAYVGWNFLYWSDVVRPGEQIDTGLDIRRIPNFGQQALNAPPINQVRPTVPFRSTDFWAQGLVFGLEFTY
jgi:hypothetical protein